MNSLWFIVIWFIAHLLYTLSSMYYFIVLLPAYIKGKKKYVINSAPTMKRIRRLMKRKGLTEIPLFKIQITTKGGETRVVKRGVQSVIELTEEPLFKDRLRVDVVTDEPKDRKKLKKAFKDCPIPLNIYVVPQDYSTKNGTLKKARALQYMVEERRKEKDVERGYIVHFDAESVITPVDFRRMVYSTLKWRKRLTEGPIVYPLEWFDSNILCRQMEANRPFNCYHCHKVMTHPPPLHLHGSNLIIEEELALELGWDIGTLDGQPFIAEDLVFGLSAYIKYGPKIFGWHGAELLEQPPKSVRDSVRQRVRWVTGVWQALEMLKRSKIFHKLSFGERFRIRATISYRAVLYSLSFLTGVFFFFFMTVWIANEFVDLEFFIIDDVLLKIWAFLLLSGLVIWLGSNQIGLARILERKEISTEDKIVEHLKILLVSPFAAPIETSGALYATLKWFLGFRHVEWIPTKK